MGKTAGRSITTACQKTAVSERQSFRLSDDYEFLEDMPWFQEFLKDVARIDAEHALSPERQAYFDNSSHHNAAGHHKTKKDATSKHATNNVLHGD